MPTKKFCRQKILPFLKFSEIFCNRAFIFSKVAQKFRPSSVWLNIWPTVNTLVNNLRFQQNLDSQVFSFTYIFWDINYKSWHAHVTFADVKRNNQWHEKKALHNGITRDPLPLPIRLHNKIHYPPSPLGVLRNGWMIPKTWATMKHQKII